MILTTYSLYDTGLPVDNCNSRTFWNLTVNVFGYMVLTKLKEILQWIFYIWSTSYFPCYLFIRPGMPRGDSFIPLATPAKTLDQCVSGPSMEHARLWRLQRSLPPSPVVVVVGQSGSSSSQPLLQTCFGKHPVIKAELMQTRGVQLSN